MSDLARPKRASRQSGVDIGPGAARGAAVLSLALVFAASAAEDTPDPRLQTPRAEAARGAVLEWCEARGGEFSLTDKLVPLCWLSDSDSAVSMVFLGIWERELAFNPLWWWTLRSGDTSEYRWGVLWLVDPTRPADESTAEVPGVDFARAAECSGAGAALTNPAKVPVRLIGPAADLCPRAAEIAREVDKMLREFLQQ